MRGDAASDGARDGAHALLRGQALGRTRLPYAGRAPAAFPNGLAAGRAQACREAVPPSSADGCFAEVDGHSARMRHVVREIRATTSP